VIKTAKKRGRTALRKFDDSTIHASSNNKELLKKLLNDNKETEYGKKYNFASIRNISDYQQQVPLTTYDDYETYIDRMTEHGERNLLTAYPVVFYASTSGTSGSPKKIPVTDKGLSVFQNHSATIQFAVFSEFYKNTKWKDFHNGAVFLLLSLSHEPLKDGVEFGSISSAALDEEKLKAMSYFITTPKEVLSHTQNTDLKYLHSRYALAEREISMMAGAYIPALVDIMNYIKENQKDLVSDIRNGIIGKGIRMPDELRKTLEEDLKPDPKRADELETIFSEGFNEKIMQKIWPKLQGISAIWAGNFSMYARKLQQFSGRSIPYYTNTYVSSEGVFGIARHPFDQCYAMIPESCFYEFIPMDGKAGSDEENNPQTLLIDEVEEGKEYELVITNQSGFYRYRMGDVIRVVGFYNESPLVVFKYRKKNIVSIAGEKFTEDHLLSAIREFERRTDISIIDYCMYPDREAEPGRYVIIIEPNEKVPAEKLEECKKVLAEELTRASTSYAHYVHGGNMGEPEIIFLQSQTFQLQREMKMYKTGLTENQLKTVRVLTTKEQIGFFNALKEEY
jgi:hypothetical protein